MAAMRKDLSKQVAVPEIEKEILLLLAVKDQLAKRSLWRSVHAVDKALEVLGWELADG